MTMEGEEGEGEEGEEGEEEEEEEESVALVGLRVRVRVGRVEGVREEEVEDRGVNEPVTQSGSDCSEEEGRGEYGENLPRNTRPSSV